MNPLSPLGQEWTTLQNNHEQYERSSLLIKLSAVFFSLLGLMFDISPPFTSSPCCSSSG
jgi:hypothetical protein